MEFLSYMRLDSSL